MGWLRMPDNFHKYNAITVAREVQRWHSWDSCFSDNFRHSKHLLITCYWYNIGSALAWRGPLTLFYINTFWGPEILHTWVFATLLHVAVCEITHIITQYENFAQFTLHWLVLARVSHMKAKCMQRCADKSSIWQQLISLCITLSPYLHLALANSLFDNSSLIISALNFSSFKMASYSMYILAFHNP